MTNLKRVMEIGNEKAKRGIKAEKIRIIRLVEGNNKELIKILVMMIMLLKAILKKITNVDGNQDIKHMTNKKLGVLKLNHQHGIEKITI